MIRQIVRCNSKKLLATPTSQSRNISLPFFNFSKQQVANVPNQPGTYIFASGANSNGQCGIEKVSSLSRFNAIESKELSQHKIKMVACGGQHSVACTEEGHVFTWGSYKYGQLGIENANSDVFTPTLLKELSNHKVVFVEAGEKTSAAVTEDGKLFTWGSHKELHHVTGSGILGFKANQNSVKTPHLVESLSGVRVKQVALGQVHGACITEDGEMFVWGRGDWGKLGNGHMGQVDLPEKLTTLSQRVLSTSLTKNGSAIVTDDGNLYVCGKNDSFLLGPESAGTMYGGGNFDGVSEPQRLIFDESATEQPKFVKVALGEHIFTAITESGEAWVWGKNIYPSRKLPISDVIDCSAARDHVAYVTKSGQFYTMGSNRYNQLGANSGMWNTQDLNHINDPQVLPGNVKQASCGTTFTLCVSEISN